MKIVAYVSNGNTIDIQLFDQLAIRKWFDYFKNQKNNYFGWMHRPSKIIKLTDREMNYQWNIILDTITELKNMGLTYPLSLPAKFNNNQQTLNELHRFFTDNAKWGTDYFYNNPDNDLPKNPIDPNFVMPPNLSHSSWHSIINNINFAVHILEKNTVTDTKVFINETLPMVSYMIRQYRDSIDCWFDFDEDDWQLNYTYFDYDLPLVILNKSILGKCPLQSFYEEDNLNAKDCTGRLGSFGGFEFDLNDNRKKIYQSEPFKNWVSNHNKTIDLVPLEFPIGYVANYNDVKIWLTEDLKVKQLDFIE